jgi:hypothetical protein
MEAFIWSVLIVGWFAGVLYSFYRWIESERWLSRWGLLCVALIVAALTWGINAANAEDSSGPCLREQTGYTLVGKVMVPYTYCAERGKWK